MRARLPRPQDLPPMEAPVTVVGDTHLTEHEPETVERFLSFLSDLEGGGGTLVVLGDLFEWWVGRPQQEEPVARRVLDGLRGLRASGVRIAFLAGNRDYAFDGADGLDVDLWPDAVRTRWGSRTVLLTHGDLLCTADRSYLRMRRLLRSRVGRGVERLLPHRARTYIAQGLNRYSSRAGRRSRGARLGIDYRAAREWMERHDADLLVAGHVHTGVHHRLEDGPLREVFVLKDWERGGGVVRWDGARLALAPP